MSKVLFCNECVKVVAANHDNEHADNVEEIDLDKLKGVDPENGKYCQYCTPDEYHEGLKAEGYDDGMCNECAENAHWQMKEDEAIERRCGAW